MDQNRVPLIREIGLNKGEGQGDGQHQKEKDRHLVFEEGPQGGAPIGIVGVAALLGGVGVEGGKGKQLLIAQLRGGELLLQPLTQLAVQGLGPFVPVGLKNMSFHYRAASFWDRVIRGSRRAISRSPKRRPKMEMAA